MFVCCECCVLSGRGLCDELITRPEEYYRLWCVVVCYLETSRMKRPWPALGRSAAEKKSYRPSSSWNLKICVSAACRPVDLQTCRPVALQTMKFQQMCQQQIFIRLYRNGVQVLYKNLKSTFHLNIPIFRNHTFFF